jgi:hypothetical protein
METWKNWLRKELYDFTKILLPGLVLMGIEYGVVQPFAVRHAHREVSHAAVPHRPISTFVGSYF